MLEKRINQIIEKNEEWVINLRRYFHENPEPSRREFNTSKKVVEVLNNLGVNVKTGFYNTGVVGIIEGKHPGPTIGLRFDMDALEMDELTDAEYASKIKGMMHACGHDAHTAMGLGAAKLLMEIKDDIHGTIKLLFQPAEEDAPNGGGAQYMIKDGALENPTVDCILGMHVWPKYELGKVGTCYGAMMAASDPFVINIVGKGVHASLPHMGIDPIVIGAHIVTAIQTIISRNVDSYEQAVISMGVFKGGTRYNVIPESVQIEGTVRTFSEDVRNLIEKRLKKIVPAIADSMGAEASIDYTKSYPALVNNSAVVDLVRESMDEGLGVVVERPESGGEDFAYFAKAKPSAFMFLGTGVEGQKNYPPHSAYFDFDESALAIGVKTMVKAALHIGRKFDENVFK